MCQSTCLYVLCIDEVDGLCRPPFLKFGWCVFLYLILALWRGLRIHYQSCDRSISVREMFVMVCILLRYFEHLFQSCGSCFLDFIFLYFNFSITQICIVLTEKMYINHTYYVVSSHSNILLRGVSEERRKTVSWLEGGDEHRGYTYSQEYGINSQMYVKSIHLDAS